MKRFFVFICALAFIFGMVRTAAATPIDFEIAGGPDSSVNLSNESTWGWTSASAELVSGLDGTQFSLDDGDSYEFDFFTITVQGTGFGVADITATLAFDLPENQEVTGTGSGAWVTLCGSLSGGYLTWNDVPQTITLDNGDHFSVDFENGVAVGLGNSTTISATVTRSIPDATTLVLLGTAMIGVAVFGRGRKKVFRRL